MVAPVKGMEVRLLSRALVLISDVGFVTIKRMDQKGFAKIVLIVLVVVLAGALGYVTLVKKPVPIKPPQVNNLQDTQPLSSSLSQQAGTSKENVEHYSVAQGNPVYKTVALSEVVNFSSISVNNYVTTNGTVVFVDGRTDGGHFPRIVLMDNSGQYLVVPTAHAFFGEWGPVFLKLKIGDIVQVWGIAERLDAVSSLYPGINFSSQTVGGLNLTGIKKL